MAKGSDQIKRSALGRGLSALIPTGPADAEAGGPAVGSGMAELAIDRIDTGGFQPRSHFDHRTLEELAASIKRYGILQPLVVRPRDGHRYELIAGERRLRAARMAGLATVPAVVRDVGNEEHLELALIENVQRADLNAIEEGRGYVQLMDTFSLAQQDVADRIGKSRVYVANKVRLLNLPEELQRLLVDGRLSEGHARALLAIHDPNEMLAAAAQVVERGMTVRDTEAMARKQSQRRAGGSSKLDADWENLRRQMESAVGTPVTIQRSRRGGAITIRFFDDGQFEAIFQRLTRR